MDHIHYAGDTLLTGSEIAAALLEYAQALAGAGSSDTVEIPVRTSDGLEQRATFVIGPASQLVSIAAAHAGPELEAPDVVELLRHKAASIGTPTAMPEKDSLFVRDELDLDL